jgi:hypothetical protein
LKEKGIDTIQLYNSWVIFDQFREKGILPWYDPKKKIYPEGVAK